MSEIEPEIVSIPGRTALKKCGTLFLLLGVPAISANAAIIYYEPSEPIPVFGHVPAKTVDIDLNGNGTVDFIFESEGWTSGFNVQPHNGNRALAFAQDLTFAASPLNQGLAIRANPGEGMYWRDEMAIMTSCMAVGMPFNTACIGAWFELIDPIGGNYRGIVAFLGVEFRDGDDTYYGWLEIDTETPGVLSGGGYINRWAYNSTPGEPIQAGQIPEPRTYSLILGIAVLGVVAMKRRFRLFRNR